MKLRVAVGLGIVALGACDWTPVDVDGRTYSCATDAECGAGWTCQLGRCTSMAAAGGSSAGGSTMLPTAGGMAQGGGATAGGVAQAGGTAGGDTAGGSTTAGGQAGGLSAGGGSSGGGAAGGARAGGSTGAGAAGGATAGGAAAGGAAAGGSSGGPVVISECFGDLCWVDPRPPGPLSAIGMVTPDTAVLVNDSFVIVVSDGGVVAALEHDGGSCFWPPGRGPFGDVWVPCAAAVVRLQLDPRPTLRPTLTLPAPAGLPFSFTPDGGVWRETGPNALSRYDVGAWAPGVTTCPTTDTRSAWTALSPTSALVACGPGVGPHGLHVVDTVRRPSFGAFPARVDWMGVWRDSVLTSSSSTPLVYENQLDGGSQLFSPPASLDRLLMGADGQPGAVAGGLLHRLDETGTWQVLNRSAEDVAFWGRRGVTRDNLGLVRTFGFGSPLVLPTYSAVTNRSVASFFQGSNGPRAAMQGSLYSVDGTAGLSLRETVDSSATGFSGLVDGGYAAFTSGTLGTGFIRSIGQQPSFVAAPAGVTASTSLVLHESGEIFAIGRGPPDGGQLLRIALDGTVTRLTSPIIDPGLVKPRTSGSLLIARFNPSAAAEYFLDGGMARSIPLPGMTLNDLCSIGDEIYLLTSVGVFVSPNGGLAWPFVDTETNSGLSCGDGLAAAVGNGKVIVSDGGAILKRSLPSRTLFTVPFVDASGRVWLSSNIGQILRVR